MFNNNQSFNNLPALQFADMHTVVVGPGGQNFFTNPQINQSLLPGVADAVARIGLPAGAAPGAAAIAAAIPVAAAGVQIAAIAAAAIPVAAAGVQIAAIAAAQGIAPAAAIAAAPITVSAGAAAISTFDSVHDFSSMTYASPFDSIDPNRSQGIHYNDRLNFNYNRIMCTANRNVSIMNSFLYKPALGNNAQGYSNNPTPITSKKTAEDFFLFNILKSVADTSPDTVFLIKSTPKAHPGGNGDNTLRAIANKLIEKGWSDTRQVPGGGGGVNRTYINLVIDVSPVLRKYYIQPYRGNLINALGGAAGAQNSATEFCILVAQEQANDPAGSLGRDILRQDFGHDNVLIEKQGQRRTYRDCNSIFLPNFSGLTRGIAGNHIDTNFTTELRLLNANTPINIKDNATDNYFLTLNYQSAGAANVNNENPNNRTSIHDTIKKIHASYNVLAGGRPQLNNRFLNGADTPGNPQATAFYDNQAGAVIPAGAAGAAAGAAVAGGAPVAVGTPVAVAFLRKRLGDRCLIELVRLINSNHNVNANRINFEVWEDAPGGVNERITPTSAVFVGEDRMAIALAILLGIPCIWDNRNFTILYAPQRPVIAVNRPQNTTFADYNAHVPNVLGQPPAALPAAGGSKTKTKIYKQVGGVPLTRIQYRAARNNIMIDEPYYFFRVLSFFQSSCNNNISLNNIEISINNNVNNANTYIRKRHYLQELNTLMVNINQTIVVGNNIEQDIVSLSDKKKMYLIRLLDQANQLGPIINEAVNIDNLCVAVSAGVAAGVGSRAYAPATAHTAAAAGITADVIAAAGVAGAGVAAAYAINAANAAFNVNNFVNNINIPNALVGVAPAGVAAITDVIAAAAAAAGVAATAAAAAAAPAAAPGPNPFMNVIMNAIGAIGAIGAINNIGAFIAPPIDANRAIRNAIAATGVDPPAAGVVPGGVPGGAPGLPGNFGETVFNNVINNNLGVPAINAVAPAVGQIGAAINALVLAPFIPNNNQIINAINDAINDAILAGDNAINNAINNAIVAPAAPAIAGIVANACIRAASAGAASAFIGANPANAALVGHAAAIAGYNNFINAPPAYDWTFINAYDQYNQPLTFADENLRLSVTQKITHEAAPHRYIFFRCQEYVVNNANANDADDMAEEIEENADDDYDDDDAAALAALQGDDPPYPDEDIPNPPIVVNIPQQGVVNRVDCIIKIPEQTWNDIITQRRHDIFYDPIVGGGKNENIKYLQDCLRTLNLYEIYSIVDERTDADFYDINDSGVRVAFDCLFYIFFDNLVDEFESETDNVNYELLPYYLFINKKDYYLTFNEIIKFGSDKEIILDDKILEGLKSSRDEIAEKTFRYFDDLFERTIEKRDKINTEMYNYFVASEFVNQYRCAVENNFTHYGFNTIFYKFMNIIENKNDAATASTNPATASANPASANPASANPAATASATASANPASANPVTTAAKGMTNNQEISDIPRAISVKGGVKSKKTYKKSIKPKKNKKYNKTKKNKKYNKTKKNKKYNKTKKLKLK